MIHTHVLTLAIALRFLWDPRKAVSNERKHGVGFREATTAFDDSMSVTIPDPAHSVDEDAFCCSVFRAT